MNSQMPKVWQKKKIIKVMFICVNLKYFQIQNVHTMFIELLSQHRHSAESEIFSEDKAE